MAEGPLVSIVVPCFNAEAFLADALDSALAQTWPHTEIVVVDDGSSDRSVEVARSFDDVTVLTGPNAGPSAARNRGIAAARGARLQFLDADDLLLPRKIELCEAAISTPSDIPFTQQRSFGQAPAPAHLQWLREPPATFDADRPVASALTVPMQTNQPLHQTALLKSVAGFRVDMKWLEDIDIIVRLALAGANFIPVPEVASLLREHHSPGRLRLSPARFGPCLDAERCMMRSVRDADAMTPDVSEVFADRLAYLGTQAWRAGLHPEARAAFQEAESLSSHPKPTGYRHYNRIAQWIGIERTTALTDWLSRTVRRR